MNNILYKDNYMLVLNKPAGISVLVEGWEPDKPYLVKLLEEEYEKIFVVHRLDKSTSGIMVFALTAEAHSELNIQFEKRETEKVYHAITVGVPHWNEKVTKSPLRVNVGHRHRTVVDDKRGIPAETKFTVLNSNQESALIEARPVTGRTHQIRVHAYALGYPLLGDILYSAPKTEIIARPALHANSLSFNHPISNERMIFKAPYPEDFENALNVLNLNFTETTTFSQESQ
jgi:RluA family pseudouridine synthase